LERINFSVIIPVFNRAETIQRALDSVLAQAFPPLEIIVIDDGSTDATPAILQDYGHKITVIRQENRGVSAARNKGIKSAKGEWIALLDSDDEWLPEKLKLQAEFIQQNPDYQILQTEEIWIRRGKRVNPMKKHQKLGGYIFYQSLPLCIISPSAVAFTKKLFEKYGGFDESLPVCEDYDLWLRISANEPVGLIPRAGILKYGGHDDQLSRQYWGMDRFRIRALEKLVNQASLKREQREAAYREIITKATILYQGAAKRQGNAAYWENLIRHYQNRLANSSEK
jgi:glycosyltransferase involved in cell wall biosynthesis